MDKDILKKAAAILVESGYAKAMFEEDGDWYIDHWEVCPFYTAKEETNADLMNECIARRQLDALFWHLIKGREHFYLTGLGHLDHREQMIEFVKEELRK